MLPSERQCRRQPRRQVARPQRSAPSATAHRARRRAAQLPVQLPVERRPAAGIGGHEDNHAWHRQGRCQVRDAGIVADEQAGQVAQPLLPGSSCRPGPMPEHACAARLRRSRRPRRPCPSEQPAAPLRPGRRRPLRSARRPPSGRLVAPDGYTRKSLPQPAARPVSRERSRACRSFGVQRETHVLALHGQPEELHQLEVPADFGQVVPDKRENARGLGCRGRACRNRPCAWPPQQPQTG